MIALENEKVKIFRFSQEIRKNREENPINILNIIVKSYDKKSYR